MKTCAVSFKAQPKNYKKIDEFVSRSAQPKKDDFLWLKKQGVTDIINFRTMLVSKILLCEEETVKNAGMIYHNIPSITSKPTEKNVAKFLDLVADINQSGGKAHIHCRAGVDRTGMYSLIYKTKNHIDTFVNNVEEMIKMGHHKTLYSKLISWTTEYIQRYK